MGMRNVAVFAVACVARAQPQLDSRPAVDQPHLTLSDAHWEPLCSVAEWADRALAVETACCTPQPIPVFGSGHRRMQATTTRDRSIDDAIASTGCELPATCPSQQCAEVFLPLRCEIPALA